MRIDHETLVLAPTDLATFLACRHCIGLDLAVARGELTVSKPVDPHAEMLRRRGEAHERQHVESLRAQGRRVVEIDPGRELPPTVRRARTIEAMKDGADVIVQARLADGDLGGYADILLRVAEAQRRWATGPTRRRTPSSRARPKAGPILQLSAYSDLVGRIQGRVARAFPRRDAGPAGVVSRRRLRRVLPDGAATRCLSELAEGTRAADPETTTPSRSRPARSARGPRDCEARRRAGRPPVVTSRAPADSNASS